MIMSSKQSLDVNDNFKFILFILVFYHDIFPKSFKFPFTCGYDSDLVPSSRKFDGSHINYKFSVNYYPKI